jgi:hypothetical protein
VRSQLGITTVRRGRSQTPPRRVARVARAAQQGGCTAVGPAAYSYLVQYYCIVGSQNPDDRTACHLGPYPFNNDWLLENLPV